MQSLKQAMNELIYKTETDSQKQTHRHKEQICGG